MAEDLDDSMLRAQLAASYAQFAPIRRRFSGPGIERGGHERVGVTPIWRRKFGAHIDLLLQDVQRYTVEASFDAEQLVAINAAILALKGTVSGEAGQPPFAERVVAHYLHGTAPAFALALLRATEDLLRAVVERHPAHVCALDALMRVAGGEGLRDLVQFHGARLLAQTISDEAVSFPDILAFVDVHDARRRDAAGGHCKIKYEVWCPGYDSAKVLFAHCQQAAAQLAEQHGVQHALPFADELRQLPPDVSGYVNAFAQALIQPVLDRYDVR